MVGSSLGSFLRGKKTIKLKGYTLALEKQIGEGGFSTVWLVSAGTKIFALKRILIQGREDEKIVEDEIAMHRLLTYLQREAEWPRTLPLVDAAIVETKTAREGLILMPFYQNGTLQRVIESNSGKGKEISEQRLLKICRSLCQALLVLHEADPKLAFRDLKPGNVLLDDNGEAVLMDFGSVRQAQIKVTEFKQARLLQDECASMCTAPFRAPELFQVPVDSELDERVDVWAMGGTIYALIYGQPPFDGTATATVSGSVVFPETKTDYSKWNDMITWILQVDHTKRPFVKDVSWRLETDFG
eukprot:Lithocolla_globosa_v1_NODE_6919_length_1015_cov_7.569792.p1 type:complete len:300 gc:universal NODE_6919_length_1015_cov_7.569792:910-11(-)